MYEVFRDKKSALPPYQIPIPKKSAHVNPRHASSHVYKYKLPCLIINLRAAKSSKPRRNNEYGSAVCSPLPPFARYSLRYHAGSSALSPVSNAAIGLPRSAPRSCHLPVCKSFPFRPPLTPLKSRQHPGTRLSAMLECSVANAS